MTLAEQFKQQGRQEGRQEGWGKGRLDGIKTVAKNLLKKGRPLNEIAAVTNLSKSRLKKLLVE
ncbi:MAG: hypothetical protein WCW01_03605 [Gammaproteobacteria bacterium]